MVITGPLSGRRSEARAERSSLAVMTGTVLAVIGILLALGVPLFVEWSRRPKLMIERGDDANQRDVDPPWRIVHVKIANLPLRGLLGQRLHAVRLFASAEEAEDPPPPELAALGRARPASPRRAVARPPSGTQAIPGGWAGEG